MTRREIEWKPMRSGDVVVPAKVLIAAWKWWRPGWCGRATLEEALRIEGYIIPAPHPDWLDVADRMIQKARKSGVIRRRADHSWEWAE